MIPDVIAPGTWWLVLRGADEEITLGAAAGGNMDDPRLRRNLVDVLESLLEDLRDGQEDPQ